MILIDHNGERMLVLSLDGHPGATVVNPSVGKAPSDFCKLDPTGKWVEDADAKEHARLNKMTRAQLLDEAVRRARGNGN